MASADTQSSSAGGRRPRPLSPHLSIYSPIITMVMSIMHRMTGVMNVGGLLLVTAYLLALASGPAAYETMNGLYSSILGRVILVGFTWSLVHHMLGGVRHAIWDMGRGFGEERYTMSWATAVGAVLITVALWGLVMLLENV